MAAVTRLGLHGAPAAPFGAFAGKVESALAAVPGFTIERPERKTSITVDRQWSIELPERKTSIVVDL